MLQLHGSQVGGDAPGEAVVREIQRIQARPGRDLLGNGSLDEVGREVEYLEVRRDPPEPGRDVVRDATVGDVQLLEMLLVPDPPREPRTHSAPAQAQSFNLKRRDPLRAHVDSNGPVVANIQVDQVLHSGQMIFRDLSHQPVVGRVDVHHIGQPRDADR